MKSYNKIYIMAVFAVKYRLALLSDKIRPMVFGAMRTIAEEHGVGSSIICVGGTANHVHMLFALSANISISDFLREVKSRTSRWINDQHLTCGKFAWQTGYGAFSYSHSSLTNVINYIERQEEHHRYKSFRDELMEFLDKYELVSDERDLPCEPE